MAVCWACGKEFDPIEEEMKYDDFDFIRNHDLEGTFGNFTDSCARCALEECMSAFGAYGGN